MFDTFAIVDWAAGNDTGSSPKRDAIWLGISRKGKAEPPEYLRSRAVAEERIAVVIERELATGRRLCIGFDFPFGYPAGFASRLTGRPDPLRVWQWYADHLVDTPKSNNRFDLAGQINRQFGGAGPFWFNGLKRDILDLPRGKTDRWNGHGLPELRAVESQTKGVFTCWQMGGAGAVGGQVMTGQACLWRLRTRFQDQVAVWPFEPLDRPIVFAEVWPSLVNAPVAALDDPIRDRAQVQVLATALSRLGEGELRAMLDVESPEEGWILGAGEHQDALIAAATAEGSIHSKEALKNDCFALPPGVDWTPVEDALDALQTRLGCRVGHERVPIPQAEGRILAEDVKALRANPPGANAAVDGYGFLGGRDAGETTLPLVKGRAAPGEPFEFAVPQGYAIRILTGALLPEGVDTVVLHEDVTVEGDQVRFEGRIKQGANARAAGEDAKAGAPLLSSGRRLTAGDISLLTATGHSEVTVHDRLRVAVLSTGSELAEPDPMAGSSVTFDANRPMLMAMLKQWGYEVVDLGCVEDRADHVRAALTLGAADADAIVTSGGASASEEDHISAVLNESNSMFEWRIAVKPGRPLALAVWDGVPVFGLPGNPVAAFVCTAIFARPALSQMAGGTFAKPSGYLLPASFSKSKKPGRTEFLRARVRDGVVECFASEGSGRISGLSWAEGLVELPEGAAEITPGTPVRYIPFGDLGL